MSSEPLGLTTDTTTPTHPRPPQPEIGATVQYCHGGGRSDPGTVLAVHADGTLRLRLRDGAICAHVRYSRAPRFHTWAPRRGV